jgi:hypothetical protein
VGTIPTRGGWYAIYMQNIAAFHPPREKPNLKFEVVNTQEQIVYTTQSFNQIASASTVKIVIGVSAEIVGGADNTVFNVSGTVTHLNGTPLATGRVIAFHVSSPDKRLGEATLASNGTYSINFLASAFRVNGSPSNPNLRVRVESSSGQLLNEGALSNAPQNAVVNITVPDQTNPVPKRRVFGTVKNDLGLAVSNIQVEALHIAWTGQGIVDVPLGTPWPKSDGGGRYEILYDAPPVSTPENPCATPVGEVNLLVRARDPGGGDALFTSDVIMNAPSEQEVDPVVGRTAATTGSEYRNVDEALTPCLGQGDREPLKWATLNNLDTRPELVRFASRASGIEETLVRTYVRAWLITGEINDRVDKPRPPGTLSQPMAPEIIYGLLRVLDKTSLSELLSIEPDSFFDGIVLAIQRGIISAAIEPRLRRSAPSVSDSLIDDWKTILARLLNRPELAWQAQLLNLVFPDGHNFPQVLPGDQVVSTPFATASTAHAVGMPSGQQEGELLIVLFANRGTSTVATGSVTTPSGWLQLWTTPSNAGTPAVRFGAYARKIPAGGVGATVDFATSTANAAVAQALRLGKDTWRGDWSDISDAIRVNTAVGASATPDAPLNDLGGGTWATDAGASKTLFIACAAHVGSANLNGAALPSYTATVRTTTPACTLLSGHRGVQAQQENPAAFSVAASADWVAATLAIREGLVSLSAKREKVVKAHFDNQGSFDDLIASLLAAGDISTGDAENLRFAFELYDRVGGYYPIVATLYAKKVDRGWHTLRDLASVPLTGGGGNDWVTYALQQQGYSNGQFPLDVPGNNSTEKANVYGRRLYDLFRETNPQGVFANEGAAALPSVPDPTLRAQLESIVNFLRTHSDFDLDRTNVEQYVAAHPNDPDGVPVGTIPVLKQVQRVYRLTSSFPAALALITATPPLDSAVKIAQIPEDQFIAQFESKVGGLTAAEDIHRVAQHYAAEVMFALVKYHQNTNEVGGMAAVPGALQLAETDDPLPIDPGHGLIPVGKPGQANFPITQTDSGSQKFPNWALLFGALNQCACKHCQTALSPGAYFVDLLQFVDNAPRRSLFDRRPDLQDIEISCTNTNTSLPYIDLVNEALEAVVQPYRFKLRFPAPDDAPAALVTVLDRASGLGLSSDPTQARAQQAEAFGKLSAALKNKGYVLGAQARVRVGAADKPSARAWVIEDDAWRHAIRRTGTTPDEYTVFPAPQTSANNDSLEVFPEHVSSAALDKLRNAIFPFNLPFELGRLETEIFLKAKNVTPHQVLEAFSAGDRDAKLLRRSIALSYLKLTRREAKALLGASYSSTEVFKLWGFKSDTAAQTIPRPDQPTLSLTGVWLNLISLVPVFLNRSGLSYAELLDLLDAEFPHRFAADPHGLHLAAPDSALIECQSSDFQIAHLTREVLQRMSFFIRLWRKLGWTMRDVDRYLVELEGNDIPVEDSDPAPELAPGYSALHSRLLRLYHIKRLADELSLSPRAVIAFYRPIDTRRTKRNPRSLFDEVFLTGDPVQPEMKALEDIARGIPFNLLSVPAAVPPEPGDPSDENNFPEEQAFILQQDLVAHVRGALRLKAEDFELAWKRCVLDEGSPDMLDLHKLSGVYRIATLCSALGLSVQELFDLEHLILGAGRVLPAGTVAPSGLRQVILSTHAALREIRVARSAKLPAAEMIYLLTGEHEADDPFVPSEKLLAAAAVRLAAATTEVEGVVPDQPNADAALLATALGKVMPADRVVRVAEIIQNPTPTDPRQQADVARYLPLLLDTTIEPLLAAQALLQAIRGTDDTTPAARIQKAFDFLRAALIEKAKTSAAITVAAELTETDEDTANVLLTQALCRLGSTSEAALLDWKEMLRGGWRSGERVLVDVAPSTQPRNAMFVPVKSGDYRFVASVKAANGALGAVTFKVDGAELAKVAMAEAQTTRTAVTFGPVTLRAGAAYEIAFDFQAIAGQPDAAVTLLYYVGSDNPALVPGAALVPFDANVYLKAFRAARLVKGLELSKSELVWLVHHSAVLDLNALPIATNTTPVPWPSLSLLIESLGVNRSLPIKRGTLFEWTEEALVELTTESAIVDAVAVQTGWKKEDIQNVRSLSTSGWSEPELWLLLRDCFTIIRRLDLRASRIRPLLVDTEPSVNSALTLRNLFRAQFSKSAWKEIFQPLRDPLRQAHRDALVGYLTSREVSTAAGTKQFVDANDLFAFFLIDVEMQADTLISRLKLALNVVQLFVHRVFLGLEGTGALANLQKKKDQWAWMEKYRVWEANRKVFLWPENWIEPELRDDKTEFFKELEEEIVQGPLTQDTALQALSGYLEKMSEVSNLEVVGTFSEGEPKQGSNYRLHVIGRTRSKSRSLFYRTFEARQAVDGFWSPWKRIDLEIDGEVVIPVVVSGKLRLIWPKVTMKDRPREYDRSSGAVEPNPETYKASSRSSQVVEIQLMWSEYNAKRNKWGKAKLTKTHGTDSEVLSFFHLEVAKHGLPDPDHYHLRVRVGSQQTVEVDVIKTFLPAAGETIVFNKKKVEIPFFFGRKRSVEIIVPELLGTAKLEPKLLGTFKLWESGEDEFSDSNQAFTLGYQYPIGTVLRSNAAVEVDFSVENKIARDGLQLSGNAAFFDRTPGTFRIFGTNFGFGPNVGPEPFFYETSTKSLFALPQASLSGASLSRNTMNVARFSTFNHPQVSAFQRELAHWGLSGLMHRLVQALPQADDDYDYDYYYDYYYGSLYLGYHIAGDDRALYTTQRIFETEHGPGDRTVASLFPLPTVEFGYGTPFGVYNWELFFHVPMLIASRLTQDLRFEDALAWYQCVFDPKQELNNYERTRHFVETLPEGARYWNFLPFFANRSAKDSLLQTLGLTKQLNPDQRNQLSGLIDAWRNNPFNPHLIARQRISAYQKFTVMRYLDNLIQWADSLFRQDTFETINEATQLYILADEILGRKPEEIQPLTSEPRFTYRELATQSIDAFSNAVVEVESLIVSSRPHLKDAKLPALGSGMKNVQSLALKSFYFKIPRNERLDRYWDTVKDRLFKIRNSMNIDGVKRRLALFEPPIDPALLVKAAAAGLDIGSVLTQLNAPLPHYRFNVWIQKATELCNEVKSFGAVLLSALEKKDAEELGLLRQRQELKMLELVRKVREQQVKEAEENITALELSRDMAEERRSYYATRSKISQGEQTQINKTIQATVFDVTQSVLRGVSGLFAAVPDANAGVVGPFPTALVNAKIGSALQWGANAGAEVAGALANISRAEATIAGLNAGYERRWEDWKLQERLAQKEIEQLNQQIAVAKIRLDIAEKELENHEQQIAHAEELFEFLEDKFTSRDLYRLIVTQLSRTHQQVYKLAYEAARTAERTFEFELGTTGSGFIQFDYLGSLGHGLLAGERLIHDIKRLDMAYLDRNKRELELQKPISLALLDGEQLQKLRDTGVCSFELPEVLFDLDFPGHYFRRIKAVRLTIACVTGPNTTVSAKLSLLGSAYRKESAASGAGDEYPYKGFDDGRFVQDPIGVTSIATGRAQSDSGLFELNFRDERYVPFEGAGAISRWRLELPTGLRQFDYQTISDVVVELSYTARDAGGLLKQGAEKALLRGLNRSLDVPTSAPLEQSTGMVRVFSLKREMPDVLHELLDQGASVLTITPDHFPFFLRHPQITKLILAADGVDLEVIPRPGKSIGSFGFKLAGVAANLGSGTGAIRRGTVPKQGALQNDLPLMATDFSVEQSALNESTVDDVVLIVRYSVVDVDLNTAAQ